MHLPDLHMSAICKLGKGINELSMQKVDFLGKNG
jgi:hypothetical protein